MKYICNKEEETFELGKKIAKQLVPGDVLGLIGDLGAGKTIFTKGVAKGLGIKQIVNSPTFVLMKLYKVKLKSKPINFVHIDAYRLSSASELEAIGLDDYAGKNDAIVVIEWADRIKKILPQKTILISIKHSGNKRIFSIKD